MQQPVLYDETSIGLLVMAARRQLKVAQGRWLGPFGLTPQQFMVLFFLGERGEAFLREVAEAVWVDNPTASRIVRGLADRGLVKHGPSDQHGRRLALALTPEGLDLMRSLRAVRRRMMDDLVRGFTDEEQQLLQGFLHRLIRNVTDLGDLPADLHPPDRAE